MNSSPLLDIAASDSDSDRTRKSVTWEENGDPSLYYQMGLSLSLSTPENSSSTSKILTVEVKDRLRVRKGKCSQLVLVEVERSSLKGLPPKSLVIAKIYDPLYISPNELVDSGFQDRAALLTYCAETEHRAYSHLKSIQGRSIPRCYGLFTLFLPDRCHSLDQRVNVLIVQNAGI